MENRIPEEATFQQLNAQSLLKLLTLRSNKKRKNSGYNFIFLKNITSFLFKEIKNIKYYNKNTISDPAFKIIFIRF